MTFVLGGTQSDFARHLSREGKEIADLVGELVDGALADAKLDAAESSAGDIAPPGYRSIRSLPVRLSSMRRTQERLDLEAVERRFTPRTACVDAHSGLRGPARLMLDPQTCETRTRCWWA